MTDKLVVAYIPEHFATPMFLAEKHKYFAEKNLTVEFFPVVEGSGRLIELLNDGTVDIAVGLTESFVADIAKGNTSYSVVGTYVKSPLCWAISSGAERSDISSVGDLAGKDIGVSRIGSGSYVMAFVLGLQQKLVEPYFHDFKVLHNFANLRDSVNLRYVDETGAKVDSDAFMWEHFTSKKFYDSGDIKRIGEIYTPWPSWVVAVNQAVVDSRKAQAQAFLDAVRSGIGYFLQNPEEAIAHICTHLPYTAEDARAWMETVTFNEHLGLAPIEWDTVVKNTSEVLQTAGMVPRDAVVDQRLRQQVVSLMECGLSE